MNISSKRERKETKSFVKFKAKILPPKYLSSILERCHLSTKKFSINVIVSARKAEQMQAELLLLCVHPHRQEL